MGHLGKEQRNFHSWELTAFGAWTTGSWKYVLFIFIFFGGDSIAGIMNDYDSW